MKRFDAEGQNFNPEKHEAFMMEESADVEEPQVIEVFQKGYQLNDRVIRHAKVKVSMPLKKAEADEDGKETNLRFRNKIFNLLSGQNTVRSKST